MSNRVGDCFKFLWPFQNVRTLPKTDDNLQKRIVGQWRLCLHCLSSEMYSVKHSRIGYARCGGVGNVSHLRVFLHSMYVCTL